MKKYLFLLVVFLLLTFVVKADPPGGECDPDICEDQEDEEVPLDNIHYLLPAGIVLGLVGAAISKSRQEEEAGSERRGN